MSVENYCLINSDNIVTGVMVYDTEGSFEIPTGFTLQPAVSGVAEGYTWDGSSYTAPIEPVIPDNVKKICNTEDATTQLKESDWIGLSDVRKKVDPDNLIEWDNYRAALREFIINPSTNDISEIIMPDVVWIK